MVAPVAGAKRFLNAAWSIFKTYSDQSRPHPGHRKCFPTKAALSKWFSKAGVTFSPGVLDCIFSKVSPTLDFFKTLPYPEDGKTWGVYSVVLEKKGHRARVYTGSGTNVRNGLRARMRDYTKEKVLALSIRNALKDGYKIAHVGALLQLPKPVSLEAVQIRFLVLFLEAVFDILFWTQRYRDDGTFGYMQSYIHLCRWSVDSLPYDGLCVNSAFRDGVPDSSIAVSEPEHTLKRKRKNEDTRKAKRKIKMAAETRGEKEARNAKERAADKKRRDTMSAEKKRKYYDGKNSYRKRKLAEATEEEKAQINANQRAYRHKKWVGATEEEKDRIREKRRLKIKKYRARQAELKRTD